MSVQSSEYYYDENPRYRCCCQFCHVKRGTIAVAAGSLLLAAYFLIKSIAFLARNRDDYRATTVLTFIIAIIWVAASVVLLIGVLREQPVLLIPYMLFQIPIIVLSAILGILCVTYLAIGRRIILGPTGATDREPRDLRSYEDHLHEKILVAFKGWCMVWHSGLAYGFSSQFSNATVG